MKKIKLVMFTLFLMLGSLFVLSAAEVPDEITKALGKGDAVVIASYLNNNVELVIDSANDVYSKKQANEIIINFFRKNTANGFTLIHKGEKEAASFVIGTLKTSNGTYRVYVLTRKNDAKKDVIQQLRIELSNE